MKIESLVADYARHPQIKEVADFLQDTSHTFLSIDGLHASAAPMWFAGLAGAFPAVVRFPVVFGLRDKEEAGYFYHDLLQLLGEEKVLFFPSTYRRAVKYAQRDAANEILRTEVLGRLNQHEPNSIQPFIVTYPDALAEKVFSKKALEENMLRLSVGSTYDLSALEERLRNLGFRMRDYVYEPGEYAVRGSILDVYSFSSEYPYRIDFFGDEIDSIRTFDVQSQLSRNKQTEVSIVPEMDGDNQEQVSFMDLWPKDTLFVTSDYKFIGEKIGQIYQDGFAEQALKEHQALSEQDEERRSIQLRRELLLIDGEQFRSRTVRFRRIELNRQQNHTTGAPIQASISPQPVFHKNFDLVSQTFLSYQQQGYKLYVLADSTKQNDRIQTIFDGMGETIRFTPVEKTLHAGFIDHTLKCCFFTDHQLFDRFHKYNLRSDRARSGKVALSLKELNLFEPGDYVVHIDHGIGRFAGLVRTPGRDGVMQEVIKLVYKNDDVVFVSIHSLHKVSKYKGKEGEAPRINRLGTGAWEKLKDRTKKKIKDIARDLIRLYSLRKEEKGFAFSPDTFLQHELEASFRYEDTPDQLKVTQEIKADMEKARPMDRLVCGDVGFGKTEIAIRAAFKAVCDNKQVVVMVPTTVLALQHYKTFCERLHDFPVRIDYLSRARSATQTRQILKDLAEGNIQIIIGTHKLIGKNVQFKDLGLLIIDEEQKFGVAVKERLRQLKVNIDTLTMTATPIPRTLQFSLMGARDLSVLQTPPPNRHPIQTEVHTFGHEVIADAINFELSRNGQTYIITNRISALPHIESLIRKYVPDARVCVAHGQMPSEKLEQIILDFVNYDFDVLVSTTIVENGIDVPNANTIIIDAAQYFGLSDLHQMRGRVGRSNRKAFCYLLAPPLSLLPDDSRRRLQAIETFCDLGSGIHIAMQDLDIRGAGNLLGAEQSGFIADLGYEAYQKILKEAITELRNDEFATLYTDNDQETKEGNLYVTDCSLESDLQMYFPETYVPGSSERMLLYRELDGLSSEEEVEAFKRRMQDRFGPIPDEGEELIRVVTLRHMGCKLGAERIFLKNGNMTLFFVSNAESPFYQSKAFDNCIQYATTHYHRCELSEVQGKRRMLIRNVPNVKEAVDTLHAILSTN